jgi:hypothetical protein
MLDPMILRNPAHVMIGNEDAEVIRQRGLEPEENKAASWDKQSVPLSSIVIWGSLHEKVSAR